MLTTSRIPPVCDFCSDTHITRDYACQTFDFPNPLLNWGSTGDWAACSECAALIDAEKWQELADRAMLQYGDMPPAEKLLIRSVVAQLHQEFNRHRPSNKNSRLYLPA